MFLQANAGNGSFAPDWFCPDLVDRLDLTSGPLFESRWADVTKAPIWPSVSCVAFDYRWGSVMNAERINSGTEVLIHTGEFVS